ncbi:MAG TPA: hypothetical protein ENN13_05565 [Candidatus Altiarchaeales archaeon]|nr:hypothetical protein [Candidatus Altiarchaeales archaeon]
MSLREFSWNCSMLVLLTALSLSLTGCVSQEKAVAEAYEYAADETPSDYYSEPIVEEPAPPSGS